jgi:dihydrolipoamide dehydrogenase
MYVYLYTSVRGVIVVDAIQCTGSSTMVTQNNEISVSYMMQEQIYDIVVIGSGPSGRELSLHSTKNGFSVALIESELVGGDCVYWSCVPSKKGLATTSRGVGRGTPC